MIRMVMMALPTTTKGLRARSDRFGGGGTSSGSSAARGLRGEMGGLSLINSTWYPVGDRGFAVHAMALQSTPMSRIYHLIRRNGGQLMNAASVSNALHDHRSVGAAETKRIRQRHIDFALSRRLRHQIDCRFNRWILKIDRRRRYVIANRQNTENC